MNRLDEIIEKMVPSGSVFTFNVNSDSIYSSRHLAPKKRYTGDQDNKLVNMCKSSYTETFNHNDGKYYVDKDATKQQVHAKVLDYIKMFLQRNMSQRHPKETKMYKFFYQIDLQKAPQQIIDPLCELVVFIDRSDLPDDQIRHNTLKICEYLYAKHS